VQGVWCAVRVDEGVGREAGCLDRQKQANAPTSVIDIVDDHRVDRRDTRSFPHADETRTFAPAVDPGCLA
jgi:hypothetical protein